MPGFMLTADAVVNCAHGGEVQFVPAQSRVLVAGAPVVTMADQLIVAGCAGVSGVVCTVVQWFGVAARVLADGQPVLVQTLPPAGPVPGDGVVAGPPPPIPLVDEVQLAVVAT